MSKLYKHPRIYHVPSSPNLQNDDRRHPDTTIFDNENVIVSIKMDGENTTCYRNNIHARSIDSQNANHPSRDYVKGQWSQFRFAIPEGMRVCGENMYAEHSIKYTDLESYFYVFSIWVDNVCWSWKETKRWCDLTGITTVPVIYEGIYDEEKINNIFKDYDFNEGYVIRIADSFVHDFDNENFFTPVAKYVRKNHVQTNEHWLRTWDKTKINKLKSKDKK